MDNICKFVSTRTVREEMNILHFVYEKNARFAQQLILPSTYSLAFVTKGEGVLHMSGSSYSLRSGDFFLVFPAKGYYIENTADLNYIYITFIGSRAAVLMERLQAPQKTPIYHDLQFLRGLWEESFRSVTEDNIDMMCEGLLLYTLSFICTQKNEALPDENKNGLLLVKQYIDNCFADSSISLSSVSEKFAYNPKYLSGSFKKLVRLSFTEYLTEKRLQYAATLIANGMSNVGDLAEMCGYSDAMYFSKVFKKKFGVSPKQYMRTEKL